MDHEVEIQRSYYQKTATDYDALHLGDAEHELALAFMIGAIRYFGVGSVLDVGSGTGRAIIALKAAIPSLRVVGIEPSSALREHGYAKGLSRDELVEGDAQCINFSDGAFDLVCSFGVLHHVPDARLAARDMTRVAAKCVFISDHNDYARGTRNTRIAKQVIKALGLWHLANLVITRGSGYRITEDDGLWYPYSIFDTHKQLQSQFSSVHFLNTKGAGPNFPRSASHSAMLGIKKTITASVSPAAPSDHAISSAG